MPSISKPDTRAQRRSEVGEGAEATGWVVGGRLTLLWQEADGVSHHYRNTVVVLAPLPESDTKTKGKLQIVTTDDIRALFLVLFYKNLNESLGHFLSFYSLTQFWLKKISLLEFENIFKVVMWPFWFTLNVDVPWRVCVCVFVCHHDTVYWQLLPSHMHDWLLDLKLTTFYFEMLIGSWSDFHSF